MQYRIEDTNRYELLLEKSSEFNSNLHKLVAIAFILYYKSDQYIRNCLLGLNTEKFVITLPYALNKIGLKDIVVIPYGDCIPELLYKSSFILYMDPVALYQNTEDLEQQLLDCLNTFDLSILDTIKVDFVDVDLLVEDTVTNSKVKFNTWKYFNCVAYTYDRVQPMNFDDCGDLALFTAKELVNLEYCFDFFKYRLVNKPFVTYIFNDGYSHLYILCKYRVLHFKYDYIDEFRCAQATQGLLDNITYFASKGQISHILLFIDFVNGYNIYTNGLQVKYINELKKYGVEVVTNYKDFNRLVDDFVRTDF